MSPSWVGLRSADGRWWWDGQQWLPVPPESAAPEVPEAQADGLQVPAPAPRSLAPERPDGPQPPGEAQAVWTPAPAPQEGLEAPALALTAPDADTPPAPEAADAEAPDVHEAWAPDVQDVSAREVHDGSAPDVHEATAPDDLDVASPEAPDVPPAPPTPLPLPDPARANAGMSTLFARVSEQLTPRKGEGGTVRRQQLEARARRPVATSRTIAVLSRKGGIGKTTTTVMLGHQLASIRDDRVVAIDANPDAGTLADRVRREHGGTISHLLAASNPASAADLRRYV
ncbi:MAG: AAA family ATPase, partial [bacterium]|nr:AAA family ATPase [bacterium]